MSDPTLQALSRCSCPPSADHGSPSRLRRVHNGFVTVDSEKMSKSLGNFFTIRDALGRYHPLALRWFLTGTQYRQPINYSQRALEEASDRIYYLYQSLGELRAAVAGIPVDSPDRAKAEADLAAGQGPAAELIRDARSAMNDDLNTPLVRLSDGLLRCSIPRLTTGGHAPAAGGVPAVRPAQGRQ